MQSRRKFLGFTLIELLVVISIIALLIGILLPALGAARRTARQLQNSTQVRGIQQGMVTFAQGNKSGGGQGYFPGMTSRGEVGTSSLIDTANDDYQANGTVEGSNPATRFAVMLNADLFTPEYILNPNDSFQAVEAGTSGNEVSAVDGKENYSYAMLALTSTGTGNTGYEARRQEWSETLNTQAVVLSDRNTGSGTGDDVVSSPWTEKSQGDWRGSIVHNDNSTGFETTHKVQDTKYGQLPLAETDNLFTATTSGSNNVDTDGAALMVWGGNAQVKGN